MDNQAGKRTRSALDEEDNIVRTREALAQYQIRVGRGGDARYVQGWHSKEGGSDPFRWSETVSRQQNQSPDDNLAMTASFPTFEKSKQAV